MKFDIYDDYTSFVSNSREFGISYVDYIEMMLDYYEAEMAQDYLEYKQALRQALAELRQNGIV